MIEEVRIFLTNTSSPFAHVRLHEKTPHRVKRTTEWQTDAGLSDYITYRDVSPSQSIIHQFHYMRMFFAPSSIICRGRP